MKNKLEKNEVPLALLAKRNNSKLLFIIILAFSILLLSIIEHVLFFENMPDQNLLSIFTSTGAILVLLIAITSFVVFYSSKKVINKIKEKENEIVSTKENNDDILETLVKVIDAKDSYTYHHSKRVAYYSKTLAFSVGIGEEVANRLHVAGMLHDIGKIGLSEEILNKHTKLTQEEMQQAKKHPIIGSHIAENLNCFKDVIPSIYYHHERYDGTGYPEGLKGQEIPITARIIAITDAFDAMTSDRSYRKGMPTEEAIKHLLESVGDQFDPYLVVSFIDLIRNKNCFEKARIQ